MLQKYLFIDTHSVNNLQKQISVFINNIRTVKSSDDFDPDKYFPAILATKTKVKIKGKHCQLYNKSKAFFDVYKTFTTQKEDIYNLFIEMNKINGLFDKTTNRITIDDLPLIIQEKTKDLFLLLYEDTLTSYDVKDHYKKFYTLQGNDWCPFCGMEQLVHYEDQKEDYDHLLAKSIYPFASVNMRNLAPMGVKCNRTHKKAKDLIWDGVKQIEAINPYKSKLNIEVNFDGTNLSNRGKKRGDWKLQLLPKKEEVKRWDFVFNISDRIITGYLNNGVESEFELWLSDYVSENDENPNLNTTQKVRDSLAKHAKRFDFQRYRDVRYVRADLFKWIAQKAPNSFIDSIMKLINRKKVAS